jgi:DNA-3-methyladenine glycosylase II
MLLAVPQPYDFLASTERFRAYGADRASVWHDGGLHRVVGGRELRIEAAPGGVRVEPSEPGLADEVAFLLGLPFDLAAFWSWARAEPVLAALAEPLAGYRPPLQPDPWEAVVTSVTAQQVSLASAFAVRSRLIERLGEQHERAWAFPARDRVASAGEADLVAVGFSRRKAEYVVGLARSELDLDELAGLSDDEIRERIVAVRGLGAWTAEWFLARHLARPRAWPAGDLALRKAAETFYGLDVHELGARLDPFQNLSAH